MKNKINVAELLRNCPPGMELNCTMYEDCKFLDIDVNRGRYLIRITTPCGTKYLDKYGCYTSDDKAKCVIFPKGKTTWDGFVPPCEFKDGDVVTYKYEIGLISMILNKFDNFTKTCHYYCALYDNAQGFITDNYINVGEPKYICLATEEEKRKLFDAIKENGYRWNEDTKTLEKLVKPKFKVGDRIVHCERGGKKLTIDGVYKTIYSTKELDYGIPVENQDEYELVPDEIKPKFKVGDVVHDEYGYRVTITEINIDDECYVYISKILKGIGSISFKDQDNWELVSNKFDITILKPFESRVLVRNHKDHIWKPAIFGCYNGYRYYVLGNVHWVYCIPYEGNEHLCGNIADCDEYYKTWEE